MNHHNLMKLNSFGVKQWIKYISDKRWQEAAATSSPGRFSLALGPVPPTARETRPGDEVGGRGFFFVQVCTLRQRSHPSYHWGWPLSLQFHICKRFTVSQGNSIHFEIKVGLLFIIVIFDGIFLTPALLSFCPEKGILDDFEHFL